MAYAGTTSTSPAPPVIVAQTMGSTFGGGWRQWVYESTYVSSDIEGANFFVDGQRLGMRVGDLLIHTGSSEILSYQVIVVGATTTDLGVGTTIGLGA